MPISAYTIPLWDVVNSTTPGLTTGPGPAVTFLWVVRDIVVSMPNVSPLSALPYAQFLIDGAPIATTTLAGTVGTVLYSWRDVRQTLEAGSTLQFNSAGVGWYWRITGYQLSSP